MVINKILLPTDGSAFSQSPTDLAIEIAKATNSIIIAIHVIEVGTTQLLETKNIEKLKARRAETCFKDFEEMAKSSGVSYQTKMLVSRSVKQTIMEGVEAESPTLL